MQTLNMEAIMLGVRSRDHVVSPLREARFASTGEVHDSEGRRYRSLGESRVSSKGSKAIWSDDATIESTCERAHEGLEACARV